MISAITVIFGLEINKTFLTAFVSSTLGSGGATIIGKTIVSNILKFLPGVGTSIGSVISGTTAGLVTTALGEAYLILMEQIYKGEINRDALNSSEGQKQMNKLFKEQLSAQNNK